MCLKNGFSATMPISLLFMCGGKYNGSMPIPLGWGSHHRAASYYAIHERVARGQSNTTPVVDHTAKPLQIFKRISWVTLSDKLIWYCGTITILSRSWFCHISFRLSITVWSIVDKCLPKTWIPVWIRWWHKQWRDGNKKHDWPFATSLSDYLLQCDQ